LLPGGHPSASASLRAAFGELEGVSPETLGRIDFISHPRTYCPPLQDDDERHAVHNHLVLLTVAEPALERVLGRSDLEASRIEAVYRCSEGCTQRTAI
jgi:hypothetical protein